MQADIIHACPSVFHRHWSSRMKVFAILTITLCFSTVLGNQDALLRAASQLSKRSVVPREKCELRYLLHYPSDCEQALKAFSPSNDNQGFVDIPAIFCEPRCGQPAVNFYISCGLDFVVPTFLAECGTNAMGQRCGTDMTLMELNTTTTDIVTDCVSTIIFGDNCTTECRNTLTSAKTSLGCCLHVLNTTAIYTNPAFNHQLWEQSCGVNVPPKCISGIKDTITNYINPTITNYIKDTITNGGVALVVSKAVFAVALLQLGALML